VTVRISEKEGEVPKFPETVYVHPLSAQLGEVTVGEYSSLWPASSLRGDFAPITIGRYTSIQDACAVHAAPGAPTRIGDFVTVGHGAVVHACTVEDNCIIGMNATVLDRAVIGRGSIVAAGAVVREGTVAPPGSFLAGVPAEIRPGRPGQEELIRQGAISYAAMAANYRAGKETIRGEELVEGMKRIEERLAGKAAGKK
jgi:carbonic anhydrase/acetyltransferase-like protein (isoleucine patch superfamily)